MTEWKLERPRVVGWNGDDPIYNGPNLTVTLAGATPEEIDEAYASLRQTCFADVPPTPEREAFLAVEYAANHIDDQNERGEFVYDFVAMDLPEFLRVWPPYAAWRSERLTVGQN